MSAGARLAKEGTEMGRVPIGPPSSGKSLFLRDLCQRKMQLSLEPCLLILFLNATLDTDMEEFCLVLENEDGIQRLVQWTPTTYKIRTLLVSFRTNG